eukprot:847195_1
MLFGQTEHCINNISNIYHQLNVVQVDTISIYALLSLAGACSSDITSKSDTISNAIGANGTLNTQRLQYLSTTKRGISDIILSTISIYTLLSLAVTRSGGARPTIAYAIGQSDNKKSSNMQIFITNYIFIITRTSLK